MNRFSLAALAVALLVAAPARAEIPKPLADVLARVSPDAPPTSVQPAAVDGLYEVIFGSTVYYFSADGKHMLGGPLVDVASRRNLSAAALEKVEREQLQPKRLAFLRELRDADAGHSRPEGIEQALQARRDADARHSRSGDHRQNADLFDARFLRQNVEKRRRETKFDLLSPSDLHHRFKRSRFVAVNRVSHPRD